MTAVLITILLLAVTGAVLVFAAVRGRTTDAHPVCRRCGFDLVGRFPWSEPTCPTCPDCGVLLIEFASVRPGARSIRKRLLACGCMLCFPAAVIGLAVGLDAVAGSATAAIKPTGLMATQLSGATRSTPSLRQLTARVSTGIAGGGDIQPVIERALLLQSDRTRPVDPDWLEFLEIARRRGHLSLRQQERFFRNAVDFQLHARPTTAQGRITLALQALVDRLAKTEFPLVVTLKPVSGTLDQVPLSLTCSAQGPLAPMSLLEAIDSSIHLVEPLNAARLETEWALEVHEQTAGGPLLAAWTQVVATETSIGPRTATLDEQALATGSAALLRLQEALACQRLVLGREGDECWVTLAALKAPPVDLVAMVRITGADGREVVSTAPVCFTPSDPRWPLIMAADPSQSPLRHRVKLSGTPAAGLAKVELLPAPALGLTSTLADSVWAGKPIVFEDVRLEWSEPASAP